MRSNSWVSVLNLNSPVSLFIPGGRSHLTLSLHLRKGLEVEMSKEKLNGSDTVPSVPPRRHFFLVAGATRKQVMWCGQVIDGDKDLRGLSAFLSTRWGVACVFAACPSLTAGFLSQWPTSLLTQDCHQEFSLLGECLLLSASLSSGLDVFSGSRGRNYPLPLNCPSCGSSMRSLLILLCGLPRAHFSKPHRDGASFLCS